MAPAPVIKPALSELHCLLANSTWLLRPMPLLSVADSAICGRLCAICGRLCAVCGRIGPIFHRMRSVADCAICGRLCYLWQTVLSVAGVVLSVADCAICARLCYLWPSVLSVADFVITFYNSIPLLEHFAAINHVMLMVTLCYRLYIYRLSTSICSHYPWRLLGLFSLSTSL